MPMVPVPQQMSSRVVVLLTSAQSPIVWYSISAAGVFTDRAGGVKEVKSSENQISKIYRK